jgi:hypothetical protein
MTHQKLAQKRTADLIVAFLKLRGSSSEREIIKEVRGRRQTKLKTLRALVASRALSRSGTGVKSSPYFYDVFIQAPREPTEVLL